jgi:2-amino-4-hydroxy-6-hydroxymethyldihydropteridine diphosphokinase
MIAMQPIHAYIGLGSNLGDRAKTIIRATMLLDDIPGIRVLKISQLIETAPLGGPPDQGDYLNGVAELICSISARQLLEQLLKIETHMGRERKEKWGPRSIDLDLLIFGDEIIDEPHLKVPHPLMQKRSFVMVPFCEIAPELVHPVLGSTMRQILHMLETE